MPRRGGRERRQPACWHPCRATALLVTQAGSSARAARAPQRGRGAALPCRDSFPTQSRVLLAASSPAWRPGDRAAVLAMRRKLPSATALLAVALASQPRLARPGRLHEGRSSYTARGARWAPEARLPVGEQALRARKCGIPGALVCNSSPFAALQVRAATGSRRRPGDVVPSWAESCSPARTWVLRSELERPPRSSGWFGGGMRLACASGAGGVRAGGWLLRRPLLLSLLAARLATPRSRPR